MAAFSSIFCLLECLLVASSIYDMHDLFIFNWNYRDSSLDPTFLV
uniref:Uncharacterized protein n=1 Tax=Setaria viridis TaxID=4556 RepID=A0A4U6V4K3_SETVI|nr:hypothetical protein SEVIR_4G144102v2 [Setaria viridis]